MFLFELFGLVFPQCDFCDVEQHSVTVGVGFVGYRNANDPKLYCVQVDASKNKDTIQSGSRCTGCEGLSGSSTGGTGGSGGCGSGGGGSVGIVVFHI